MNETEAMAYDERLEILERTMTAMLRAVEEISTLKKENAKLREVLTDVANYWAGGDVPEDLDVRMHALLARRRMGGV